MGCELGKLASSSSRCDGNNALGPSEPPPPAAPDPRLPLTARQKYTMIASWKGISRAMTPTGICMFIKWVNLYIESLWWLSKNIYEVSGQHLFDFYYLYSIILWIVHFNYYLFKKKLYSLKFKCIWVIVYMHNITIWTMQTYICKFLLNIGTFPDLFCT